MQKTAPAYVLEYELRLADLTGALYRETSQFFMSAHDSDRDLFANWFRDHATILTTLDPDEPLDDLEPLREIVGDARVIAVGENAHFIQEFTLARQRILRFLAERCGFTVFAFEFGFSEGFALDRWLQGAGADADLTQINKAVSAWGAGDMLRWLRWHNQEISRPIRFVGIDLPEAGGTLRPALDPVADYLRDIDPESLPFQEVAVTIADRFAGTSGAAAAPASDLRKLGVGCS
ncbi:MAG: erythromycin esterase family protein [Pseudonocardia sp.]